MKNIPGGVRISSFHPRKQHNFEQAAVLAELFPDRVKHVTGIYFPPALVKMVRKISAGLAGKIGKRSFYKLPGKYVVSLPATEIRKWRLERKKGPAQLSDFLELNEYWQESVLRHIQPPQICISFDGVSNLIFRNWKNKSKLILDLTIGIPQYRIKVDNGSLFQNNMLTEVDEVRRRLFATYKEEVELADLILCGSEFTKKTVVFFYPEFEKKCKVLPYGADLTKYDFPQRQFSKTGNLKFVFVGRLSWRKGADLLISAWREFVAAHKGCELHFFGIPDQEVKTDPLPENCYLHGWTAMDDLIAQLKAMDVFVFPTTFEGSSYAIYQAMALKLPVITTMNSGTVLAHGESCEIVEVGDQSGLIKAMDKMVNDCTYRQRLAEKAYFLSKNYTWDDYKTRLGMILEEFNS
jgi:glycosyltransferase involved in cell wall biosynthesis